MGPDGFEFELSGGHAALDFANTLDRRPTPEPKELLRRYADLADWGKQAGLVSAAEHRVLCRLASRKPRAAQSALRRARTLREVIFELCASAASGGPLPPGPLAALTGVLRTATAHLVLAPAESLAAYRWSRSVSLDRISWAVTRAAAALLTEPPRGHLRVCAAESCDWLFLDISRNQSRRWCDMAVCGNRAKVRRFREAQRP